MYQVALQKDWPGNQGASLSISRAASYIFFPRRCCLAAVFVLAYFSSEHPLKAGAPWKKTVGSGAQWANATEEMVVVPSTSSLGESTVEELGCEQAYYVQRLSPRNHTGTLECQGEWELKARQSGHQDLGICWVSQFPQY